MSLVQDYERTLIAGATRSRKAPQRTTAELLEAFSAAPWLRAVTDRVGTSCASAGWHLRQISGSASPAQRSVLRMGGPRQREMVLRSVADGDSIMEHPLLDLLTKPNPFIEGSSLIALIQRQIDLIGEMWVIKEDAAAPGSGEARWKPGRLPAALWPVPGTWVAKRPTPTDPMVRFSFGSFQRSMTMENVIWAINPDPANPYGRGTSPALALADEIDIHEYASKYLKHYFFNSAMPPVLITSKQFRGREDTDRLEERWMQKAAGLFDKMKPMFLSGDVEVTNLQTDIASMGLSGLRSETRDTILHVYGCPPEIFGIVENSNRATAEAADYIYGKWVIAPRLEFLRGVFQSQLVDTYDPNMSLEYESPIRDDRQFRREVIAAAPEAFSTDDVRALAGLDPLPDGAGRVFWVRSGMTAVSESEYGMLGELPDETPIADLPSEAPAPAPAPMPGSDGGAAPVPPGDGGAGK